MTTMTQETKPDDGDNRGSRPGGSSGVPLPLAETEVTRANFYLMLSQLLFQPPSEIILDQVAGMEGDDTDFGAALNELAASTRERTREQIHAEHESLFVGVPTAALMPYGSYYLTGSLFGRPLARLRIDMVQLGIARNDKSSEPEDHIGSLFETIAALILGRFGDGPAAVSAQRVFFEKHVADWAPRFFADLEAAENADYYRHVARVGALFIDIEREAFRMAG